MLRVISEIKPRYVVGENVAGIVNMELDRCLSDLESIGYATEAYIIPACAIGAPHRRDRVWIVAYMHGAGFNTRFSSVSGQKSRQALASDGIINPADTDGINGNHSGSCSGKVSQLTTASIRGLWSFTDPERNSSGPRLCETGQEQNRPQPADGCCPAANSQKSGLERGNSTGPGCPGGWIAECFNGDDWYHKTKPWLQPWIEVATRFCGVDDGVPDRVQRLKALGNAVVPQIPYIIFEAIKSLTP